METQEFLQSVLGAEGYYCAVGITDKRTVIQKFYPTIDSLLATAKNFADEGVNAYFALATFNDGTHRRTDKVNQIKSFWIDMDCGGEKEYHYPTQSDAFAALKTFCKDQGLPKPWVVNSGFGLHVYWPLIEPVSFGQWQPVAARLKAAIKEAGLKTDPAPTADAARILRVPGTLNFKSDPPAPVEILQTGGFIAFEEFAQRFATLSAKPSFVPRELSETTKALMGNMESSFKKILEKSIAGKGCAQLAHIATNQADIEEPLWRAGLSIAQHCSDRAKAIHFISRRHPQYDPNETEDKAAATKGPYTCDTFRSLRPEHCKDCEHKIKSPIVLGREVAEASEGDNEVVVEGEKHEIPKFPAPYFRSKGGGVYKRVQEENGEESSNLIYHNDIYVLKRVIDPLMGECLVVRLHLPKDGVKDFSVPLSIVLAKDELRKHLASHGVAMVNVEGLMHYLAAWANELQFQTMADEARKQFGWTSDDMTSFAWGQYEVFADRVAKNTPSKATALLFPALSSKGTLDEWKRTMLFYNQPNMEMHQFMIGIGFGGVLMPFTPVNCVQFHVYSPESGYGKTTTLSAAASIWGDPYQVMMKDSDTVNMKMNRAEIYKNIFLPIDELTNAAPKTLSDFLYQSTSGMQKGRMQGSENLERPRGDTWQTLFLSTGNASVMEKISTYKAVPKGEAMRILEHRASGIRNLEKTVTDALSMTIKNNYGVAAVPYLQYIMQNKEAVASLFAATQQALDKAAGFGPVERFHSALLACAITGLVIAKRAGLVEFDIKPVVKWAITMARKARDRVADMDSDAEVVISNYLAENYNNVLRIKSTDDVRINGAAVALDHLVVPDGTPRAAFTIRYEYDVKKMFIIIKPFKEWCVKQQLHYNGILESLQNGRTQAKIERKRLGKGTRMNLPPMPVIVLDCSGFMDDEVENAATNENKPS